MDTLQARRCVILFSLAMVLLLTGCAKTATTVEEVLPVRAQVINWDGMGRNASYSGEVRGRYESQLAFQVNGKIIKRYVELGSVVQQGDALMEIDPKDIQQAVNSSSAQVASADSQLRLAEQNLNRYRQLYEENAVSRMQYEQYQNAYDVAAAAARQASAQYSQGANQLGYSTLYANNAGVIASISAEAGQVVGAGQAVVTLVQDGEREIEINVPENSLSALNQAPQIKVTFWALPGITVEGKVREISPVADKVARTYKVRISLLNSPAEVKLGMTASVLIANPAGQQAAYIPLAAVYQTGNQPHVWVITNGAVNLRTVKLGVFGSDKVQVLEGLQQGDLVVTAGVHKLREGQKVRVAGDTP